MWSSQVVRVGCIVSREGVSVPIRAFRSPHRSVSNCGWISSNASSSWAVAWASVMPRFASDEVGGRYTFAMFTRWLLGNLSLIVWQYSFPILFSTCSELRTYVASPPLVPFDRLYSISLYPCTTGGSAGSAIHVSCRQRTSNSSCSIMATSFRYERPLTFMLPTVIPYSFHLCMILGLLFGARLEPFVRLLDFDAMNLDLLKWGRFRLGMVLACWCWDIL